DPAHVYTGQSCGGCFYLYGPTTPRLNPSTPNPVAFATQAAINGVIPYTGNLGWNSITGPTYWDLDLALSRVFRITERQNIELRGDAFNLFNSFVAEMASNTPFATNYGNPATGPTFANLNSAQFGQILGAYPTRKIQFSLKYSF